MILRLRLTINFFILCVFLIFPLHASAWVVGFAQSNVHVGGDMDGITSVSGGGSTEVFPLLEDDTGTKISFGIEYFEVSLNSSKHHGSHQGMAYDAEYRGFNLDLLLPLNLTRSLKPVFLLGVGLGSVIVDKGSIGAIVDDATIFQNVFRVGAGMQIYFSKTTLLEFMHIRYDGDYTSVNGVEDGNISDEIQSQGDITTVGIKIHF